MTREDRISFSKEQVRDIVKRAWLYVLIGVAIGAYIHNWIPQSMVENVVGSNNPFAVLLATAAGIIIIGYLFNAISYLFKRSVFSWLSKYWEQGVPSVTSWRKTQERKLLN